MGWKLIKRANAIAFLDRERKRQEDYHYDDTLPTPEHTQAAPEEPLPPIEEVRTSDCTPVESHKEDSDNESESVELQPTRVVKEKKSVKKTNKKKKVE